MTSAWDDIIVAVATPAVSSIEPADDSPGVALGFPWQAELSSKAANANPTNPFFHPERNETIVRLYTGCPGGYQRCAAKG
jgi:hypothetical protein